MEIFSSEEQKSEFDSWSKYKRKIDNRLFNKLRTCEKNTI